MTRVFLLDAMRNYVCLWLLCPLLFSPSKLHRVLRMIWTIGNYFEETRIKHFNSSISFSYVVLRNHFKRYKVVYEFNLFSQPDVWNGFAINNYRRHCEQRNTRNWDLVFAYFHFHLCPYLNTGQNNRWLINGVLASGWYKAPLSYMIYSALFMPPFWEGGAVFPAEYTLE